MRSSRRLAALTTSAALAASGLANVAAAPEHSVEDVVITSPVDGTEVHVSIFRPAGASAENPVPMVLEGHGWSGSRQTTVDAFADFLDAGFGVLSIDQRGHGDTGSVATVMDPEFEGADMIAINDHVTSLDWVARDLDEAGNPIPDDPRIATYGASYGGGYQFLMALNETLLLGDTRVDVMAPQITWNDLNRSLAPNDVPRSTWLAVLNAAGNASARVAPYINEGFAYGVATGEYPDGTVPGVVDLKGEFASHAPSWFVEQGIQLDIPVLLGQGHNDNLFNFNEAWENFDQVLTPEAKAQSVLVGYIGGHALPNVAPLSEPDKLGIGGGLSDCIEDDFRAAALAFFQATFAGQNPAELFSHQFNLTTSDGECIELDAMTQQEPIAVGPVGAIATPTAGGAPIHIPLASGEMTVAGIATLTGTFTTTVQGRAFFALSRGVTPADARVIQNNVVPLGSRLPVVGEEFSLDLNGVAAKLGPEETLFLTISPVSDMFVAHGSRVPGGMLLEDLQIALPITEDLA